MTELHSKTFATRAVHAGERAPRPDYTPVVAPIHPTVGFLYDNLDDMEAVFAGSRTGFVYPRYGSPTLSAFEAAVADLEEGQAAHAFASGMAALHAALLAAGVRSGESVLAARDLYGATYTLLEHLFSQLGVTVYFVDVMDLNAVEAALKSERPRLVLVETISNPLVKVANLPTLAEMAHRFQAQLLVDNTFASPYLCHPLKWGADYVIHSATKFIAGHGDVLAGVVVTSEENRRALFEVNKLVGAVLGPFEAWLALRGLKTLPLRLRQQCSNAQRIADWLSHQPGIEAVHYPGLPSHAQHQLARQMFNGQGYGGVLAFEIAGADQQRVFRFMERLQLCLPATTLGDVYSLVMHPATTSHRSLPATEQARLGIRPGLVRLSAGIEDADDIIADLAQALASCN
mgnify:CR=1 FL=1